MQKLLIILRLRDYSLPTVCWLEHDVYEKLPIMPKSASDITKKIYKSARRSYARHTMAGRGGGGWSHCRAEKLSRADSGVVL